MLSACRGRSIKNEAISAGAYEGFFQWVGLIVSEKAIIGILATHQ